DEPPLPEPATAEPPVAAPQPKIRARVRDLPPPAAAAAEISPERPQSFVGRLGRRLGEASSAPPAPRFDPLPPAPAPEARRAAETARPREPVPKLTTPPPAQTAERGGRPSLPRNRRLYRRATLPADIEIGGVPCTLIDVSIGGFAATGVPAQLQPNALVPVMIRLVIDGIEVGTQLKARIVYVTQSRSAGRFVELTPSQMAFLRYIVTWRGESVGAVGTTTLLDAIAGGGDRGFTPGATGRSEFEPKSRWWAGLIGKKINPPR
ncbi:MAG TPA: PilZ domain-containing protein, partial [Xanthobacteraceae bacterium]